jgi:hypothetical protein
MDTMLNPQNDDRQMSFDANGEKSELMQYFESQVHDMYWAYKDLLKAIFEKENEA